MKTYDIDYGPSGGSFEPRKRNKIALNQIEHGPELEALIEPKKSFFMTYWQLFFTAMAQVTFVAMNIIFINQHRIVPMLVTGFMISLVWTLNVKKVAFGGWIDRVIYATGAMVGTGLGYLISTNI